MIGNAVVLVIAVIFRVVAQWLRQGCAACVTVMLVVCSSMALCGL